MSSSADAQRRQIFILSGSTGRTCEEVLNAALAQFEEPRVQIKHCVGLDSHADVIHAVQTAAQAGGAICHSVVVPELKNTLLREATRLHVPTVDVLGPLLILLQDQLGQQPRGLAGLAFQAQRERLQRIAAVDFTLGHDDGAGLADLSRADVVLVGASRVSKSVTCFYLAYEGISAANVPLIPGHDPPAELVAVDRTKVVGLTMNANRLHGLRQARVKMLGNAPFGNYGRLDAIEVELREIERQMARYGWRRLDVSYMSVEEVAKQVLSLVRS